MARRSSVKADQLDAGSTLESTRVTGKGKPLDILARNVGLPDGSSPEAVAAAVASAVAAELRDSLDPAPNFETLTISIGRETFSPVKYNTFEVGPFSTSIRLEPGEDIEHAYLRGRARLLALVETEFNLKRQEFDSHLKRLRGVVE
jgi:hypothetical protein